MQWLKKLFAPKPKKIYWTCCCGHEVMYGSGDLSFLITLSEVEEHMQRCPRYKEKMRPIIRASKMVRRQTHRRKRYG